jgi:RHS repeat-associated protein
MKPPFSFVGRDRCSRRNAGYFALLLLLMSIFFARPLYAQVGDNNVAGPSGIFNGQAGGCGYDPYTGNATRSITDIAVARAVGEYPLALVRTANSRTPSMTGVFGWDGGWSHNYNWTMEDSPVTHTQNFPPVKYTVNFPDGRVETFRAVTWDTVYRVRPGADTPAQSTSNGVRERFLQLNLSNMYAYLILPDGGAVEFRAQQKYDPAYGRYWYTYRVTGVYDPHGLKTTIDSEVVGTIRRITRVTEPAGRYLQFTYDPNSRRRITQITEYINGIARRSVQYNYPVGRLTSVVYYGNNLWTARYQYTGSNIGGGMPLLLWTCDDPMYPGAMRRIAYEYKTGNNADGSTAVYGQILRERYYDGDPNNAGNGIMVSALTVGASNPINHNTRTQTRWDGSSRTFTYTPQGYLTWASDFMGPSASQGYDTYKYIAYVTDRRNNRTDFTNDPITGNVTQIKYPFTPEDTPGQGNTRPMVNYTYTNSYYLHTIQNEAGNLTTITRDPNNNRVTRIDYPDGGWETFSYDGNHFYQLHSHRMVTGGTENWTYDSRHRTDTYRNPDSPSPSPNPSAQYYYDTLDRVSSVHDAMNHVTDYQYNDRDQITLVTLPTDPVDNTRHTIVYAYNNTGSNAGDGTLISVTDQLNHVTSYTYDDYRRLRSVTPPVRGAGDNGTYTTWCYYDDNGIANDYKFTDSDVTWVKLPSGKKIHAVYDDNRRKTSVTVAPGTADEATTSYLYDPAGNATWVTNPLSHNNVHRLYDARNRPYQITLGLSQTTSITYDTAGRTKEIDRPNGQVITYDNFDAMNRVTQQTATNTRGGANQNIRSSYSYYASGPANLLNTFQDPHLFGGSDQYTFYYDPIGRKRSVTYPLDSSNPPAHRIEQWSYDAAGRLYQFGNRGGKVQTFSYDALNRITGFTWDDGITPGATFGYDAASRLTGITNANAVISRTYFNDNLLKSETETATGGVARAVNYTYDADQNRASLGVPGYTFNYDYTNRNQLQDIINNANNATIASYVYDARGNVTSRTLNSNSTSSGYNYDVYDRVTSVDHYLASGTRTIQYGYDDTHHSNNRLWVKRVITAQSPENNKGEVFSYDLADQVSAFQLNVLNPNQVSQPLLQTMLYDPNGNRQFTPTAQYATANDLSQYTTRTIAGNQTTAAHDLKGNTTTGLDGSVYTYDAQNRLLTAQKSGGSTMTFAYDGLNRQVSRRLGNGGTTYYSVWDGWNLVEDYHKSGNNAVVDATYVYGATGLVRDMENANHYYYQDGSGSISHLANNSGTLLEWYRYDVDGNPVFYYANDTQRSPNQSGYSVRHLFTGQQWHQDIGLYDLRNRFYSPDVGRFLESDPIGFRGGTNLYRYCGNNPVTRRDHFGLQDAVTPTLSDGWTATVDEVKVTGSDVPEPIDPGGTGAPSGGGGAGGGGEGRGGSTKLTGITFSYGKPSRNSNSNTQQPPGVMVGFDIYHPTTTAEFIIAGNIIEGGDTTDTTPAIDPIDLLSAGIAGLLRSSISSVAARATTAELSVIRYTRAGETFIRYESGNPAFSRVTASGGVRAGTYAAPVSNGVVPLELRASTYNLPSPNILRSDAIILRPPAGTPVIGPRSVVGGLGDEVIFPFGY